jgi:uncharacterized membrane protein
MVLQRITAASGVVAAAAGAVAQSFTDLGAYPGSSQTIARGVSAGGAVVVGQSFGPVGSVPWRWTRATGMQSLGWTGYAFAVSDDGAVAVGVRSFPDEAVRWDAGGGVQWLGYLSAAHNSASAWAVSADGSVVVGRSGGGGLFGAFRWTRAGGMQALGTLPGLTSSWASGVSADGSVVVGRSLIWPGGVATDPSVPVDRRGRHGRGRHPAGAHGERRVGDQR